MARKIAVCLLLSLTLFAQERASYDALFRQAEAYYAEKSFSRAHEVYEQAAKLQLAEEQRRWVEFRLADTAWRNDAASPSADPSVRERAQRALEEMVRRQENDRIRAEANESLGDYYALHPHVGNPSQGTQYYVAALDYWAGSEDIENARKRYLGIVFRIAAGDRYHRRGHIPREILVNTLTIAKTPADRARARYLLATELAAAGPAERERALEHFEIIIAEGKGTEWYDDALISAARLYASGANVVVNGRIEQRADFARALALYRRILSEFTRGTTPFYEEAENAIRMITASNVGVVVTSTFLPDSEQEIVLNWRNVKQVRLTIASTSLVDNVVLDPKKQWPENITAGAVVRTWTYDTNDRGDHAPGVERIRLEPRLAPGAYVVTAEGGGHSARHLILVTDAHILVHATQKQLRVYVSDVLTGQPIANARVRTMHMLYQSNQRRDSVRVTRDATTDANGLAAIDIPKEPHMLELVTAAAGARQAFHHPGISGYGWSEDIDAWRIYAFTDRPAYRPGETVHWKIVARVRDHDRWRTPAGRTLRYEITDPRGSKVFEGDAKLNDFGTFWAELPLTSAMPLGVYMITFRTADGSRNDVASAQLFRLEEYKLPEFLVRVTTHDENGKPRLYRLGETIEATIEAEYYFGGPVANATVEVVVHQQPWVRYWYPWREFSWYHEPPPYMGEGAVMKRETLRTDAAGRATLRIETNAEGAEMLYRIEARVVDASRREVRGTGTVRVTRQRYSVLAHAEHAIHRPGEKVTVKFKAIDANDQPVRTTGTVRVVRREWREPQPPQIRIAGYREEEVMTTTVTTDAEGEATFTFTPKREGYYAIQWTSEDRDPDKRVRVADLVTAETAVWVAERTTLDTGYRPTRGVEVIVDKETLRAGQTANVLIATPSSGRWVVLTTTGDDILDTQVVRMDGTVKLVQIPLDQRHVPNFFVTASSVFDRELASETERVLVPPVEHFLNVEVKTDREEYQPRQEGTVTITTRDVDGRPVRAEVALSVTDEAVTAIQEDVSGDPRAFFFGHLRPEMLQVSAGVQVQQYVRLIRRDGQLVDDRYAEEPVPPGVAGGVAGRGARLRREAAEEGMMDMSTSGPVPSPAPPPPPVATAPAAAPQAIAVTGNQVSKEMAATAAPEMAPMTVEVRSDFRSTAFWQPNILTDANGTATVTFRYPEALTTWRATARAVTSTTQVGMGSAVSRTKMPLIVRLQAPRFFVAGDRVVVSAVINNNTDQPMRVTPALEVEGLTLAGGSSNAAVDVPANGDARVDWTVSAERAGTAKLRVTGRGAQHGDAMERTLLVYEHGIDKLIARSGKLRAEEAIVRLDLPRERRATELVVQVAPSLAVTMLDALPYLIEFPYGCTEQTMSRFLPAAVVARTLTKLGATATPPQLAKLNEVTRASIARLYDMQHGDGSWGWWKEDSGDAFMTAYVVWGFALARDAQIRVDAERIGRAARWLEQQLVRYERDIERQAWMLHALSAWNRTPSSMSRKAYDNVWTNRERLSAYGRALLALTAHRYGDAERTAVLVRNLESGAKIDRTPDQSVLVKGGSSTAETIATAHWGASGFWWRWHESPVETTAFVLQALTAIDPKHQLVEPAMNWLVKNRRGAQWSNTRDTAISVLALNDYLLASGETLGNLAYEVSVNGKVIATKSVSPADALTAPSRFSVDPSVLNAAEQQIRIRRTSGTGALYFSAEARFVSLEEPVRAAGNELFVRREYFRLKPKPTLLKGVTYDRVPLKDRESIASGERVEVVVTVETKNDYEYLVFEDLKPAGFEAVELQSGTGLTAQQLRADGKRPVRSQWIYQELRDRKVALFANQLEQGLWEIRYTLRAEVPGSFHALPLLGHAMYVPDIRANSDEVRVEVTEAANPAPVSP
jgi:alpha-2-macroglobulin